MRATAQLSNMVKALHQNNNIQVSDDHKMDQADPEQDQNHVKVANHHMEQVMSVDDINAVMIADEIDQVKTMDVFNEVKEEEASCEDNSNDRVEEVKFDSDDSEVMDDDNAIDTFADPAFADYSRRPAPHR